MNIVEASMFKKMERDIQLDIEDMKNGLFIQGYRLNKHVHNKNIHTDRIEENFWNNKINIDDDYIISDENLIFTRL